MPEYALAQFPLYAQALPSLAAIIIRAEFLNFNSRISLKHPLHLSIQFLRHISRQVFLLFQILVNLRQNQLDIRKILVDEILSILTLPLSSCLGVIYLVQQKTPHCDSVRILANVLQFQRLITILFRQQILSCIFP